MYIMRVCDKANNQITYIPVKGALLMANDNQIAFLCSRLKELREKNGCTMDDMAKKIDVLEGLKPGTGMNKSSISRVEGGKTAEKTLLEMARKYCKVFGMSESQTEQFLRGEKVAVPDTSALLKNSQLIDELNKEYSKVVIPKVVVDELDNIKNKNSDNLAYLFISHGLSVVKYISDRIGVMYLGNIVELAESQEMFDHPTHPYTEALLSAIPTTDVDSNREMIPLEGDIPSPVHPPKGCKFHTRCKYCNEII